MYVVYTCTCTMFIHLAHAHMYTHTHAHMYTHMCMHTHTPRDIDERGRIMLSYYMATMTALDYKMTERLQVTWNKQTNEASKMRQGCNTLN